MVMVHVALALIAVFLALGQTSAQNDTAEETQHATCRVITQEIQTTANATIKRELKGVCTSRQLDQKFAELEQKLLLELTQIKSLLGTIDQDVPFTRSEVAQLNNTVHTMRNEKVFFYYWEVPEVRAILHQHGTHVRSPDLYILGHQVCIQLYPNYLESSYLGLQLRPNSNLSKKHKFAVLDQRDGRRDIKSHTIGGAGSYETVYKIPYAKLEERNYLQNDLIIVKLTIYLDS